MSDANTIDTGWSRCADCGALIRGAHLAGFLIRGCSACGSSRVAPANQHDSRLADAGAVRIKRRLNPT